MTATPGSEGADDDVSGCVFSVGREPLRLPAAEEANVFLSPSLDPGSLATKASIGSKFTSSQDA
jgi:hypothetical protein